MKRRVRGQALSESMGAILASIAIVGCVVGAFALAFGGQANGQNDFRQIFAAVREHAQSGGATLTIVQGTNSTTVSTCSTVLNAACTSTDYAAPQQTVAGAASFTSASVGTWTTITFFVWPDGKAQIYGHGDCPSDLKLTVASISYSVSCDPLSL